MVKKAIIKSENLKKRYIKISDRIFINLFKIDHKKNFLLSKISYTFHETNDRVLPAYRHGFQFYISDDIVYYKSSKNATYHMNDSLSGGLFYYTAKEAQFNSGIMIGKIVKSTVSETFLVEATREYGVELANLLNKVSSVSDFSFINVGLTDDKKYWAYDKPAMPTIYSEINPGE